MFVEVYGVKLKDWSKDSNILKDPANKRLIELTGARIRPFQNQIDKCEIKLPTGLTIICAGSYNEVTDRIAKTANSNIIVRV